MTWAPTETQKAVFNKLAGDQALNALLNGAIEVQRLTFASAPSSGAFKLTYAGEDSTEVIASNINAANLQAALRSIDALSNVTVTLAASNTYDVTFNGVGGNISPLTKTDDTLDVSPTITTETQGDQKVFDHVPQDEPEPYVVIQMLPMNDRSNYTYRGFEAEVQITTWYRSPRRGQLGVQNIQKRIDELLHKAIICISGWNTLTLYASFIGIEAGDDNVTLQGIQRYKLQIGES